MENHGLALGMDRDSYRDLVDDFDSISDRWGKVNKGGNSCLTI